LGPKRNGGHDLDLSGSRDVIVHVTVRLPMDHFLFCFFRQFFGGKTNRLATIHTLLTDRQTDDRRTQHCSICATASTVG